MCVCVRAFFISCEKNARFIHVLVCLFFSLFFLVCLFFGTEHIELSICDSHSCESHRENQYFFLSVRTIMILTQTMDTVYYLFSLFKRNEKGISQAKQFGIWCVRISRSMCVCVRSQYQTFSMSFSSPIVSDSLLLDAFDFVEVVLIRISFNLLKSHYTNVISVSQQSTHAHTEKKTMWQQRKSRTKRGNNVPSKWKAHMKIKRKRKRREKKIMVQ